MPGHIMLQGVREISGRGDPGGGTHCHPSLTQVTMNQDAIKLIFVDRRQYRSISAARTQCRCTMNQGDHVTVTNQDRVHPEDLQYNENATSFGGFVMSRGDRVVPEITL